MEVPTDNIIHYWAKIDWISEDTADLIDWDGHKKAMAAFKGQQQWVTKFFSGWTGSRQ